MISLDMASWEGVVVGTVVAVAILYFVWRVVETFLDTSLSRRETIRWPGPPPEEDDED